MTAKLPFQIEIPKRTTHCAAGKEELNSGHDYFSLITQNDEGALLRQDYCSACWMKAKAELVNPSTTHWKSKVAVKLTEKDKYLNRDEKALSLLKQAIERNSPDDYAEAFVLALYLARRKQIAFRQAMPHESGMTMQLYEILATEEMLCLPVVNLSSIHVNNIQQQLAEKLGR